MPPLVKKKPAIHVTQKNVDSFGLNAVSDSSSAKHPLKMQFRKNPSIPNDRPLIREYTSTFVFSTCMCHRTGDILTF